MFKEDIIIPPSKSHTLRALFFGALGRGRTLVQNPLDSTDTDTMLDACRVLGASIRKKNNAYEIEGINGKVRGGIVNAEKSGIVFRFFTALSPLSKEPLIVKGDPGRPIKSLMEALKNFKSGQVMIYGEDSQPVSALLIASHFAKHPVEIIVKNPGEKPWVDLTLSWFDFLGVPYQRWGYERYRLEGGGMIQGFDYTVPGDFSSAAFPAAAALITRSKVRLLNLDKTDPQGDKQVFEVFRQMGAEISDDFEISGEKPLVGCAIDVNPFIDAIPVLAVLGCFAEGETHIYNGAIARTKECNRLWALTKELRKMGADIRETDDGLVIRKSKLYGARVHSHHDHRMAMALSVAAMGAEGETIIEDRGCVAKTYPTFFEDVC